MVIAADLQDLGEQDGAQRQGQVAVGDRSTERPGLRPLDVDVDPLVVARRLREEVDPLLGDLDVVAVAEVLTDAGLEPVDAIDGGRHGPSIIACRTLAGVDEGPSPAVRWRRRVVAGAVLLAVAWPVVRGHDSFPLSTYPMYAETRGEAVSISTAVGLDGTGGRRRLSLQAIAETDDPLIAESAVDDAVRRGRGRRAVRRDRVAGAGRDRAGRGGRRAPRRGGARGRAPLAARPLRAGQLRGAVSTVDRDDGGDRGAASSGGVAVRPGTRRAAGGAPDPRRHVRRRLPAGPPPRLPGAGRRAGRSFDPVGLLSPLGGPWSATTVRALVLVTIALGLAFTTGVWFRVSGPAFALALLLLCTYRSSWGQLLHFENLMVLQVLIVGFAPSADVLVARRRRGLATAVRPSTPRTADRSAWPRW